MAKEKNVKIDKNAGAVQLTVIFGNASIGSYKVFLYDSQDQNPKLILEGMSNDNREDKVFLPDEPSKLIGRAVLLKAVAATLSSSKARISATMRFTQEEVLCPPEVTDGGNVEPGQEGQICLLARFKK